MKNLYCTLILGLLGLQIACSPIKPPISNYYTLDAYSTVHLAPTQSTLSIAISQPEAMAGYQTEQMHYVQKPFELSTFVHNAWISSPANMIYPLIMESLQKTGYFFAVVSSPYVDKADYRLDTQILALQQNFLTKPSTLEFAANIVLTHTNDNRVVASTIIRQRIPCPTDTPYGGVLAANNAARAFTARVSSFVITQTKHDKHRV